MVSKSKNAKFHRAPYCGARILLRQDFPESENIFDLIIKLSKACKRNWQFLSEQSKTELQDLDYFLDYAAALSVSLGNYRVRHTKILKI